MSELFMEVCSSCRKDVLDLTRYHFNGYVSVSLRHISSQLNSTGTKRAIALVQTLSFPCVAVRGRQRSGLRD